MQAAGTSGSEKEFPQGKEHLEELFQPQLTSTCSSVNFSLTKLPAQAQIPYMLGKKLLKRNK